MLPGKSVCLAFYPADIACYSALAVKMKKISELPHSPASERNKAPIGEQLQQRLADCSQVLEIGSGTGQHAEYFAQIMPWLHWQCSDRGPDLGDLNARIQHLANEKLAPAFVLDVLSDHWPQEQYDAVYSANTAHIMSWPMVCAMLAGVPQCLHHGGQFILYGPFRYGDRHTAASNQAFDLQLRQRDPAMGIRDALEVQQQASISGLKLIDDVAMPANNRLLVFTFN